MSANPHVIPGLPRMLPPSVDELLEARVMGAGLPEHMHEGIIAYIRYGRPCGSFLEAIIRNDARDAMRRADQENQDALGRWFLFMIRYAPIACWGSAEAYQEWRAAAHKLRTEAAAAEAGTES